MSLSKDVKAKIVAENARAANDTGSAEVQIALLSARIDGLQPHFAKNPRFPAPQHARLPQEKG